MQDTKTPVKIAVVSVIINIIFSFLLMGPMRHGGLAFANAIASAVNFTVLFVLLRKKLGRVDGRAIARSFIKMFIASLIMGIIGLFTMQAFMWSDSSGIFQKSATLAGVIALCVAVYIFIMHLMKSEELKYLLNMRKKRTEVS
jgi:putative peptidoglycan lipid II flippase